MQAQGRLQLVALCELLLCFFFKILNAKQGNGMYHFQGFDVPAWMLSFDLSRTNKLRIFILDETLQLLD